MADARLSDMLVYGTSGRMCILGLRTDQGLIYLEISEKCLTRGLVYEHPMDKILLRRNVQICIRLVHVFYIGVHACKDWE